MWIHISVLAAALTNCGLELPKDEEANPADTEEVSASTPASGAGTQGSTTTTTEVTAVAPTDSTGQETKVALALGAVKEATVALHGFALAEPTLDSGSGIVLEHAMFNIAAVKLKAPSDADEAEKALEKLQKEQEKKIREEDEEALKKTREWEAEFKKQIAAAESVEKKAEIKAEMDKKVSELKGERAKKEKELAKERLAAEEKKDKTMKWKGPYLYDAVKGTSTPALPSVELTDGSYRRIELRLMPYRDGANNDPLLNHSFYLAGTVTVGSVQRTFSVSYHGTETVKIAGSGTLPMKAGESNTLALAFEPKAWFTGVDFAQASLESDGSILIDQDANKDLLQVIRKNIKGTLRCAKDDDGDGKIEIKQAAGDGALAAKKDEDEEKAEAAEAQGN
jgi:hypothetical protein